ncbi:MAG: hypothetical protein ACJAYC_001984 [Halieaceae bacterium]|jgi:hypothetical protein
MSNISMRVLGGALVANQQIHDLCVAFSRTVIRLWTALGGSAFRTMRHWRIFEEYWISGLKPSALRLPNGNDGWPCLV